MPPRRDRRHHDACALDVGPHESPPRSWPAPDAAPARWYRWSGRSRADQGAEVRARSWPVTSPGTDRTPSGSAGGQASGRGRRLRTWTPAARPPAAGVIRCVPTKPVRAGDQYPHGSFPRPTLDAALGLEAREPRHVGDPSSAPPAASERWYAASQPSFAAWPWPGRRSAGPPRRVARRPGRSRRDRASSGPTQVKATSTSSSTECVSPIATT